MLRNNNNLQSTTIRELCPSRRLARGFSSTVPHFSDAVLIGGYGTDKKRNFELGLNQIKYLKMPASTTQLQMDLSKDMASTIFADYPSDDDRMKNILKYIVANIKDLRSSDPRTTRKKPLKYDVVCYKAFLRTLLASTFGYEKWYFLVTKYKGTIYVCPGEEERPYYGQEIRAYGPKFKQYLVSDDPGKLPCIDGPICEGEEFCVIFSRDINCCKILFAGGIDSFESDTLVTCANDLKNKSIVELKSKKIGPISPCVAMSWWSQNFPGDVKSVVVGWHTGNHIVSSLTTIPVESLPGYANGLWSPQNAQMFCAQFIEKIVTIMSDIDDKDAVFKFEYDRKNSKFIVMTRYSGKNEHSFLKSWYTDHIDDLTKL